MASDNERRCRRCGKTDTTVAHCHFCCEDLEEGMGTVLRHLYLMHPKEYGDGPERWPDGEIVIVDQTLTPDDFLDS